MAKGKRGRPKKEGERYACGKLKKPAKEGVTPTEWDRIRTTAKDENLRSEVGRLFFHGELTERQKSTALWIGQVYGAFEGPFALRRSTRSPSYEIGIRGIALGTDDTADAERDFFDLQEHIPFTMRALIEQLCVENRAIPSLRLDEIRWLLNQLAEVRKHWTQRSKKRKTRRLNMSKMPAPAIRLHAPKKSPHFDRPFAALTIGELFPDLNAVEISQVIAFRHALKDRETYRGEVSARRNISENRAA